MNPSAKRKKSDLLAVLISLVVVLMVWVWWPQTALRPQPKPVPVAPVQTGSLPKSAAPTPMNSPAATAVTTNHPDFQMRPFPVAYESSNVQWTLADGKDTNVIRQLAHNPLEFARMVEENPRIFRRQLVYLKDPATAVFERSKLTGETVQQLTLPGLDGQELQFQIVKRDAHSSRQGMFSGHLAGNNDSLVTLAFMDGREAFTILAPKENIFLVGEPREDGQVIVKAIDPNTYGVGPADQGDDFIKTDSTNK